jgi:uncharacterized protein YcbK (DUF882 family)
MFDDHLGGTMERRNFFTSKETQCKCGCGLDITYRLRDKLNYLRQLYGGPIHVTSGARCKTYNSKVGGVPKSRHIKGLAADLSFDNLSSQQKIELIECATGTFRGIGIYPNFMHVDLRIEHGFWVGT